MKKISILFIVAAISLSMSSCSKYRGYKESDNGLFYKFYVENDKGAKPQMGDVLTMTLLYKIAETDSILEDSRTRPNPFMLLLKESDFKGDLFERLGMMHKGDSASFIIKADSFFIKTVKMPLEQMPKFVKPETMLKFEIKLSDVKPKAVFEKEMAEAQAKFKVEMEKRKAEEPEAILNYVKENKITARPTKTGLYYVEVVKGNGSKPKAGQTCVMNYTGKLFDGKIFDSSEGKKPFEFILGKQQVIPGWDEAIAMMSKGGKAKLVIPSSLAYGENGAGNLIMPYTPLVFDVELIDFK
jgi:FKBP-type peptidyl-prolyl cis-trans isomerase